MKGNVIVGQSGGPTAAINSSLAGVYRTARDRGALNFKSAFITPRRSSYGRIQGQPVSQTFSEMYGS